MDHGPFTHSLIQIFDENNETECDEFLKCLGIFWFTRYQALCTRLQAQSTRRCSRVHLMAHGSRNTATPLPYRPHPHPPGISFTPPLFNSPAMIRHFDNNGLTPFFVVILVGDEFRLHYRFQQPLPPKEPMQPIGNCSKLEPFAGRLLRK